GGSARLERCALPRAKALGSVSLAHRRRHCALRPPDDADRDLARSDGAPPEGRKGSAAEPGRASQADWPAAPGAAGRIPADRARAARRSRPGAGAADRGDGSAAPEAPGGLGPARRPHTGFAAPDPAAVVVGARALAPAPPGEAGAARACGGGRGLVPRADPPPWPQDRVRGESGLGGDFAGDRAVPLSHRAGGAGERHQAQRRATRTCPAERDHRRDRSARRRRRLRLRPRPDPGQGRVGTRQHARARVLARRRARHPLETIRRHASRRPNSAERSSIDSMKRPRVLLADDHRLLREAFVKLLEPECDVVGAVADGRALLEAAPKLRPDVVVLDVAMPQLNGLDAARQLKRSMPDVKVIFLTVSEDPDLAAEAFRAGGSGFVLKNSAASELLQAI